MNKRAWYIGLTLNVLLLVSLLAGGVWYFNRPVTADKPVRTQTTAKPATVTKPIVNVPTITSTEVVQLTNDYRATNGLAPLTVNPLLEQSACAKAQHMIDNNYWSHNAPDGTEPWYFFKNVGYVYDNAGENLANGYTTSKLIVDGWIKSPSHEANLSGLYTETGICVKIGIAYQYKQSTTLVVAHYGTPY